MISRLYFDTRDRRPHGARHWIGFQSRGWILMARRSYRSLRRYGVPAWHARSMVTHLLMSGQDSVLHAPRPRERGGTA